jgi:hypothetical protein
LNTANFLSLGPFGTEKVSEKFYCIEGISLIINNCSKMDLTLLNLASILFTIKHILNPGVRRCSL